MIERSLRKEIDRLKRDLETADAEIERLRAALDKIAHDIPSLHDMSDIVERLRDPNLPLSLTYAQRQEAADEIERLRYALATVLGDAIHGQDMSWEMRCQIGRRALGQARKE